MAVKSDQSVFDHKIILLALIDQVKVDTSSVTVGAAFGAIGALVEYALTEKSRDEASSQINKELQ